MDVREWHEIKRYTFYKAINNKFHLNKDVNSAKVDIEVCIIVKSKIFGRVIFIDNNPAKNILVSLEYFANKKNKIYQAVTDSDGIYNFFIDEYVPKNFKIHVYKNNIFS